VEGKNHTAEQSRDAPMVHRAAWNSSGQPSVVRTTDTRPTDRPGAKIGAAVHQGVHSGIDAFIDSILAAVPRPVKSARPQTLRA